MIEALIARIGEPWRARPEVPVAAARGVIDLVLTRRLDHLTVVCECHSELRRLDLALRRLAEKSAARGTSGSAEAVVSTLLLLRSTATTRALARAYESTLGAAFPGRTGDAVTALGGSAAWPGPVIIWARVEGLKAEILEGPPRGVRVER